MNPYLTLFGTVFFTVVGQLVMKFGIKSLQAPPDSLKKIFIFVVTLFINPYFLTASVLALLASFCWALTLTKLNLAYAYPFMSLSFVLVIFFSGLFFQEPVPLLRWLGVMVIGAGVLIVSRT